MHLNGDDDIHDCDCGGIGCPECMPCGWQYAAGSEECDFCEHEAVCCRLYMQAMLGKRP